MTILCWTLLFSALVVCGSNGLIIPEELPSILSIIYSNIPPIRNGFDTRFGVGFRLGQHADVQLVTEIGPQIETQPLGENSERRRHAPHGDFFASSRVAQKQKQAALEQALSHEKQTQDVNVKAANIWKEDLGGTPEPESWLAKWHRSRIEAQLEQEEAAASVPEVTVKVDDPVVTHLKKLYKNNQQL